MNKKRILKINLSRKKSLAGVIGVIMLLVVLMPASVLAGNTSKTTYYNTTSYGFATATRDKENSSPAYIYHQGNAKAKVEVRSSGVNYTSGNYNVAVGEVRYLSNTVYQNGRRNCYLFLKPYSGGTATLRGSWAPDTK